MTTLSNNNNNFNKGNKPKNEKPQGKHNVKDKLEKNLNQHIKKISTQKTTKENLNNHTRINSGQTDSTASTETPKVHLDLTTYMNKTSTQKTTKENSNSHTRTNSDSTASTETPKVHLNLKNYINKTSSGQTNSVNSNSLEYPEFFNSLNKRLSQKIPFEAGVARGLPSEESVKYSQELSELNKGWNELTESVAKFLTPEEKDKIGNFSNKIKENKNIIEFCEEANRQAEEGMNKSSLNEWTRPNDPYVKLNTKFSYPPECRNDILAGRKPVQTQNKPEGNWNPYFDAYKKEYEEAVEDYNQAMKKYRKLPGNSYETKLKEIQSINNSVKDAMNKLTRILELCNLS